MKAGSLDPATLHEYENLSSLKDLSRSVIIFRVHGAPGKTTTPPAKIYLDLALTAARNAGARLSQKTVAAVAEGAGCLLMYGLETGLASSAKAQSTPHPGGFLKNLHGDPLWPILEEAGRKLWDSAPCILLCGLAGPSREDADILFDRALEGSRLASADCPALRLAPVHGKGEGDLLPAGVADASLRSLGMRALDYIKKGYSKELSLVSAAESLGVNPFHLSHAISRELGIGFSELLGRVRINRAKELMAGGGSIKEASYLVGFTDQAYFTRVFKKFEGQNPRQFIEETAKKYKK
ncbi:MAG: hypothetical protein CVV53_02455 [Spirochaetae bacterium HGW-Spirochaetae-9]|nr:MAG: hypothetical protein CVV53_02455 [Spirochaetae bacterium HGW-Spirochaetae-9]